MVLQDFGRLWIASSDLTSNSTSVRKLFEYGADSVVLKTAVRDPPKKGRNYIVRDGVIIYHDFSVHPGLERLLDFVPWLKRDAIDGGFLEGFRKVDEIGSVSSYSHDGDPKLLSVEESNELCLEMKKEFPDRHVVQSLGISQAEDFALVDQLVGDAVELNLRYFHEFQHSPILLPNLPEFTEALGVEEQVETFHRNRREVYRMTARYASMRIKRGKPVLLKLERRQDIMDYVAFSDLDFDGFTYADSGVNVIANHHPLFGFRLINKGKTSGAHLLPSTLAVTGGLRDRHPRTYLSASGGIMNPLDSLLALTAGANSVQLCSAIYLGGMKVVGEFSEVLGR